MKTKTITGKTRAWLTAHAAGSNPEDLENLHFTNYDMETSGWTEVGTADITVTLVSREEFTRAQIATLKQQRREVEAKAAAALNEIDSRIQNLLGLPAEG